ncbi:hypothetical protein [Streptomyces qinglanensis]
MRRGSFQRGKVQLKDDIRVGDNSDLQMLAPPLGTRVDPLGD